MEEGALGVGSSLIYAPAFYAKTDELIALCEGRRAEYGGMYISHMRSEGNRLLEAVDELITIAREAGVRPRSITSRRRARRTGRRWTAVHRGSKRRAPKACRSPPTCTPTRRARPGLDAAMPPWVQEGGYEAGARGCRIRRSARGSRGDAHARPTSGRTSARRLAGACCSSASRTTRSKPLTGKTLAEVAKLRGKIARGDGDGSRHRGRQPRRHGLLPDVGGQRPEADRLPWVSFGSDAESLRAGGRVPEVEPASARVRQLRAAARPYVRDEK